MIPTDSLEIVRAVAHFRNFTAAAKHLHKVPSAISYTVRKLEERLGVQLFLRDSKRVDLMEWSAPLPNRLQMSHDE